MTTLELASLMEEKREQALARYQILQPYLEGHCPLQQVAQQHQTKYRTLQRWVNRYRRFGLVGLAHQPRQDRGQRRLEPELEKLIVGLALQKTKLTIAAIHRQVVTVAAQQGWAVPGYDCVYETVKAINPALMKLAQEGSKAYSDVYDLLYRREATHPNEIWQADHTELDIFLLKEEGQTARPWLTVIEDDYSRCIAGYYLSFDTPSSLNTSLALRQAIWRKAEANWVICGIPEIFYTDHGSDFTSHHLEQVAADLKVQLVFSTAGVPRGRGRIERFFRTVNQLFLLEQPGYLLKGKPQTADALSLPVFQEQFHRFLLDEYHQRPQQEIEGTPQERWSANGFLPQMPASLEKLDLLLLTLATTRRIHQDGIRFNNLRYLDTTLAAYIGEDVVIRYDPRDMAEIRVYHQNQFICRAICQELAGQTISLKEIIHTRNRQRRQLQQEIRDYQVVVDTLLQARRQEILPAKKTPEDPVELRGKRPAPSKLKRYYND